MKSAGLILKEARLTRQMELADVARITKIRPHFLELLESDDFSRLPNAIVAKGFIRNYAQFLGLNPDYLLAVFRRDFSENPKGQIVPRGMVEPVAKTNLWTPRSTVIAVVVLFFTLFLGYLGYQYTLLVGPPSLVLSSPPDRSSTTQDTVEVYGKTDPEATISVNGNYITLDKGGQFSVRLQLNPGANLVTVTARSKNNRSVTVKRHVFLTSGP